MEEGDVKTMVSGYIEADDGPTQLEIQTDDKKRQSFTTFVYTIIVSGYQELVVIRAETPPTA